MNLPMARPWRSKCSRSRRTPTNECWCS
jgi:hypothetical protein